jgi:hypothetical protein
MLWNIGLDGGDPIEDQLPVGRQGFIPLVSFKARHSTA